ncbi:MAG TPA: type IV-A pilus assembly ATPase PilB [Burkholderiaceae bacterium]|nr:type IV-A pilus assembly ATPase PilB [Burkholderiaceae bacterium]
MSAAPSASQLATLPGLARALMQNGRIKQDQVDVLLRKVSANGSHFVDELIAAKTLTPLELAQFCAHTFGHPLLDLNTLDQAQLQAEAIDSKLVASLRVIGLRKRGNRIAVAVSDPTNLQALDQIKFATQMTVDPVIVEHDKLIKLVEQVGKTAETKLNELAGEDLGLELDQPAEEQQAAVETEVDDAPVVRFLQKVMIDAINMGASDLHFEPYEKFYRIRFRVDGVLQEIAQPPLVIKDKLASRIKVISRLDISEKRVPQDGRMKLVLGPNKAIDFRVSTLPTLFGEKIVMRILDASQAKLGIDALGYEPDQKQLLLDAVSRPYGMVLVTGPTGSGKTVSLYTCLNILNQPGVNISTAEDPAEIQLAGINQVNVNEKAGLTFAAALRSFLRQDPDVIMVGEIRDLETADIAIKAAQTGHMVFSTLHTNDAPTTLTRLANMGVPAFNIASSVIMITAQRLGRRLCTHCKVPLEVDPKALLKAGFTEADLDGSWTPYKPVGCEHCNNTGYKGRVGIYQVMPISEETQRLILSGGTALDIAAQAAREGVRDLRTSGLWKVKQGMTSIEEVLAVTNE